MLAVFNPLARNGDLLISVKLARDQEMAGERVDVAHQKAVIVHCVIKNKLTHDLYLAFFLLELLLPPQ